MGLKRIFSSYTKITYSFAHKCGFIGAIFMVGLMLLTVGDVVLRYFFSKPILGSFELTEFFLVALVFLAIPWAAAEKFNVRVDLLVGKLPERIRAKFDSVTCAMALIVTALFAWYTVPQAIYKLRLGSESDMLNIPVYPFYFLVAFGFFVLFFVLVANLIDFIKGAVKR